VEVYESDTYPHFDFADRDQRCPRQRWRYRAITNTGGGDEFRCVHTVLVGRINLPARSFLGIVAPLTLTQPIDGAGWPAAVTSMAPTRRRDARTGVASARIKSSSGMSPA